MGFTIGTGVSALTVFLQGILSFFSPCVLPLVPLYIGYLSGGAKTVDEDGAVHYRKGRVMLNTFFFVAGVSFAFFLLGLGFTAAGRFFAGNKAFFTRAGGILVVLFGLYQLGLFGGGGVLSGRYQLPLRLDKLAMNPLVAFLFGFTFSFAWTPCVGPALASVLLMASSAGTRAAGFSLIGLYTLGFVLPFLAVGLFTGTLLDLFKRCQRAVRYTAKAGGALLVLMGVMMFTGWMNGFSSYLSGFGSPAQSAPPSSVSEPASPAEPESEPPSAAAPPESEPELPPAPDFTLKDQFGDEHTLSNYKGKVVFLNFWATWCPPCRQEMPDIQALYEESGGNAEELIILGVANPKTDERPANSDVTEAEVAAFLAENGYTYPTVMDLTGDVFSQYGVSAFPTTFMIDRDGNVFGFVTGAITRSIMDDIVRQTTEGKRS